MQARAERHGVSHEVVRSTCRPPSVRKGRGAPVQTVSVCFQPNEAELVNKPIIMMCNLAESGGPDRDRPGRGARYPGLAPGTQSRRPGMLGCPLALRDRKSPWSRHRVYRTAAAAAKRSRAPGKHPATRHGAVAGAAYLLVFRCLFRLAIGTKDAFSARPPSARKLCFLVAAQVSCRAWCQAGC